MTDSPADRTAATSPDGEARNDTPPYRDASLPVDVRVEDLLGRMTLAEKAGILFHDMVVPGPDGALSEGAPMFSLGSTREAIQDLHISHFNLLGVAPDIRTLAEWQNRLQEAARQTRLGIPITLSTDPRNHFTTNVGTAASAGKFSQWPEMLGFAAIGSEELIGQFADMARQEYLSVGLRAALHPQIDLATEARWSRIAGGFGEDAELTAKLAVAYIRGFQRDELGASSVSTMAKHFPGGGPQKDGEDPHFAYGREQVYPGDNWEYHLQPFRAVIEAGVAQMMPYYGMPVGTRYDEVGFAFNRAIITDLLRDELGFDGIVCTDWQLVTDGKVVRGQDMPARAWGVEHLDELSRAQMILDAGCDQFGGESRPDLIIALVEQGRVSEERLDASVRRLLRAKFVLGLFENPFVDVETALTTVGRADFVAAGAAAQRRAMTLLANTDVLPLDPAATRSVYVEGMDAGIAGRLGAVVATPGEADIAVIRLKAPYEPRPGGFEAGFHAGSLEFPEEEHQRIAAICAVVPTIIEVYLDRPAVLTPLVEPAAALLVSFGAGDDALVDVLLGETRPEGSLPFDLPRSQAAVVASRTDVQYDTVNPLFVHGHGLRYA